jgi:hypothetical protein
MVWIKTTRRSVSKLQITQTHEHPSHQYMNLMTARIVWYFHINYTSTFVYENTNTFLQTITEYAGTDELLRNVTKLTAAQLQLIYDDRHPLSFMHTTNTNTPQCYQNTDNQYPERKFKLPAKNALVFILFSDMNSSYFCSYTNDPLCI